jgi:glutathione S-transferase
MLRLHHAPLACSFASRLALHESGRPHEVVVADTKSAAYRAWAFMVGEEMQLRMKA